MLTVERLEDGEVSPYLAGELRPGDELELRGPIGGYFVWDERSEGRCSPGRRIGDRAAPLDAPPPLSDRKSGAGAAALLGADDRRRDLP